jgi:hypothetical protein
VIHFDPNTLINCRYARESHPTIEQVVDGKPPAAWAAVWYEFLIGPIEKAEINLAHAFL